jgi:hypothetical protein
MPGRGYFARLGVDAEVDPEALPIEQRFIDDGMAKLEKLLKGPLMRPRGASRGGYAQSGRSSQLERPEGACERRPASA